MEVEGPEVGEPSAERIHSCSTTYPVFATLEAVNVQASSRVMKITRRWQMKAHPRAIEGGRRSGDPCEGREVSLVSKRLTGRGIGKAGKRDK